MGVGVAVSVGVGVGVGPACPQYLPRVSRPLPKMSKPPQMIISLQVQTAECAARSLGALTVLVAVQLL